MSSDMESSNHSSGRRKVCFSGQRTVHEFSRASFSSSDGTVPTKPSSAARRGRKVENKDDLSLSSNDNSVDELDAKQGRTSRRKKKSSSDKKKRSSKSSKKEAKPERQNTADEDETSCHSSSSGPKQAAAPSSSVKAGEKKGPAKFRRARRELRSSSDTTTCSAIANAATEAYATTGMPDLSKQSSKASPTRTKFEVTKKTTFRIKPVTAGTLFGDEDGNTQKDENESVAGHSTASSTIGSYQPPRKLYDDDSSSDEDDEPTSSSSSNDEDDVQADMVISDHTARTANTSVGSSTPSFGIPTVPSSRGALRGMEESAVVTPPESIPQQKRYPDYATEPTREEDCDDFSVQLSVNTKISDITMNDFKEDYRRSSNKKNNRFNRRANTSRGGRNTDSSCCSRSIGLDDLEQGMIASHNGSALFDPDTLPTTAENLYQDSDDDNDDKAEGKVGTSKNFDAIADDNQTWTGDETITSRFDDDDPALLVVSAGRSVASCASSVMKDLVVVVEEDDEEEEEDDHEEEDEEKKERSKKAQHKIEGLALLEEEATNTASLTGRTKKGRTRKKSLNSTSTETTTPSVASYSSDGETSSVLDQKRAMRAQRLERAKERIRRAKEEKEAKEAALADETRRSLAQEEAEERARMTMIFQWYNRCGRPNKADFQRRIKRMLRNSNSSSDEGDLSICLADVDLMPWSPDGSRVTRLTAEDVSFIK